MEKDSTKEDISKNTTIFIQKLWKMMNIPEAVGVIGWSPSGMSFVVQNREQLASKLLPMFFRHNNLGSFIRQLHLYDFHKISVGGKAKLEYRHKYFQRRRPDLLKNITKKTPKFKLTLTNTSNAVTNVSHEIAILNRKQEEMNNQLLLLKQENRVLKEQISKLSAQHTTQVQMFNRVLGILVPYSQSVNNRSKIDENASRIFEVCPQDSPNKIQPMYQGACMTNISSYDNMTLYQSNTDAPDNGNNLLSLKDLLVNVNQLHQLSEHGSSNQGLFKQEILDFEEQPSNVLAGDSFSYNLISDQLYGLAQDSENLLL